MEDDNADDLFPSAPILGTEFKEQAGEARPSPATPISEAASREIETVQQHNAELDDHDQAWQRTRNSIAAQDHLDMNPDGLGASGQDLKRQIDEAYTQWQNTGANLRAGHEAQRQDVREAGVTLSGDFEIVGGETEPSPYFPEYDVGSQPLHDESNLDDAFFPVAEEEHTHEHDE